MAAAITDEMLDHYAVSRPGTSWPTAARPLPRRRYPTRHVPGRMVDRAGPGDAVRWGEIAKTVRAAS